MSASTTLDSIFVSYVPWHTKGTMCLSVGWAKVLPHCLFSVSVASLCISVFFTALLTFNNMPKAHHRGGETPRMAVVIIFVCEY